MIVVADASPIICLSRIGRLDLLPNLLGSVLIPEAVRDEITAGAGGHAILDGSTWIEVRPLASTTRIDSFALDLDAGEAAASALALEAGAAALLIDERNGRRIATRQGLVVVGVVGVILRAHRAGMIPAIRPVLDDLVTKAEFWLSTELIAAALEVAGESDAR